MKTRMKFAIANLAMVLCFAWNPLQAFGQAERIPFTATLTARQFLKPPVMESVGPLMRMTVHVLWYYDASDSRLDGYMEITGVWMIDPRDGSATGHGTWVSAPQLGGETVGSWAVDGSGIMHGRGFVAGGELDGAIMNAVSVEGHPLQGQVKYEGWILLPASK